MGLRERKAQQTRQRIVTVASAMFAKQGFDATTMEAIAAAAEVHPATLYRYFPSKDLIVLAEFATIAELVAKRLEEAPADEDLSHSMRAAVDAVFAQHEGAGGGGAGGSGAGAGGSGAVGQHADMRDIIDQSPAARARVWDLLEHERQRIGAIIAERIGEPASSPRVVLSARFLVMLVETAADLTRYDPDPEAPHRTVAGLIDVVASGQLIVPAGEA